MASLMHEVEEVKRIFASLIVNVERKWFCAPAGKTVRPDVIAALPPDYFADLAGNSFAECGRQPVGNLAILHLLLEQVNLELPAENYFHTG